MAVIPISRVSSLKQVLDLARCFLWLFALYMDVEMSKNSC